MADISRREFLAAAAGTIYFPHAGKDFQDAEPLKGRAARAGIAYGTASLSDQVLHDSEFAALVQRQCSVLVPEVELKWRSLRPAPDRFDYSVADAMVEWSERNGLKVHGHTLVWHDALPAWFASTVHPDNAQAILGDHIQHVVSHYSGRIASWDVVNEAVFPPDSLPQGLRNTPWLRLLGEKYIEVAFRAAADADPRAQLVYNEAMLDYDSPFHERQRRATLALLRRLLDRDVPVHALGIQAHLRPFDAGFSPRVLERFLVEVERLGLSVVVSEFDVRDQRLPGDTVARDAAVADIYREYLDAALSSMALVRLVTWGLSDRYTWLSRVARRDDGTPVRPLPFDAALRPKAAFYSMATAFDHAVRR